MPDVLLLCEFPTLSGGERSMLATLEGIRRAGFRPTVAAPLDGPLAEAIRARGIELVPCLSHDAGGNRLSQDARRIALAHLLSARRPDLLHANSLAMGRLSGPVARSLAIPSIAHLRDIIRLSDRAMADLNCHDRLLAVSAATRRFHVARGLAVEKTHVLFNGVDLGRCRPRPPTGMIHRELGIPATAPLIGTIGQIALRKGQDVLARAAVRLAPVLPEVHYLIIGQRHSKKEESRAFEEQLLAPTVGPLAGRWHLLGPRDDVPEILNELALLVHPARQEPLGRVLLESAAAGVPVVATDVGGTSEIFPPGSAAARLVAPDDTDALAEAIDGLIGNPPERSRLGAAARRRAEEAFAIDRTVAGLVEHYRQVLGR